MHLLNILKQVSFIVPPTAIPGRLGVLFTSFLCMVNTLNSVSRYSPQANSGPTALITWIVICICFQIFAILEYAWVIAVNLTHEKETKVNSVTNPTQTTKRMTRKMDRFMLLAFPVSFMIFALFYWM